ncbi:MAG: aspartate 1-decarboxylase [Solirubrobacterales bacterium]
MRKSKIHRATVSDCDVWEVDNGSRFVTYVIEGEPGSGAMQVNGAAAHLTEPGHRIIVASFAAYGERDLEQYEPVVVHVDVHNRPVAVDSHPEVLAS